jgi:hypothetical protein
LKRKKKILKIHTSKIFLEKMNTLLCKRKATVSYEVEEEGVSSAPQKKVKFTTKSYKMCYATNPESSQMSLSQDNVAVVYNKESGVVQVRASSSQLYKTWNTTQVMTKPKLSSPAKCWNSYFDAKKPLRRHSSLARSACNQLLNLRKSGLTMVDVNTGLSLFNLLDNFDQKLQMEISIVECPHRCSHKEIDRSCCLASNARSNIMLQKCHVILKLLEVSIPNKAVLLGYFISNCLQYITHNKGNTEFALPQPFAALEDIYTNPMIQGNPLLSLPFEMESLPNWESLEMKQAIASFFKTFYANTLPSPLPYHQNIYNPEAFTQDLLNQNGDSIKIQA